MFSLIRRILFCFDPEQSHHIALVAMKFLQRTGLMALVARKPPSDPATVMGIEFPNRIGLAAGLDKNADYIDALAALGFGFVEVGTVTPVAQPGNPQPRLFRLEAVNGIINRMGFNNMGVDHLVEQVRRSDFRGVLGINIGKNKDTPAERAVDDYVACIRKVYPLASYITVNLSSPNTPGLRDLQFGEPLENLLAELKREQSQLQQQHQRYVPIAVKIAPDMAAEDIKQVAQALLTHNIDGVIATNTTIDREAVRGMPFAGEAGGLSGGPLTDRSTEVIRQLNIALDGNIPIIGVGGILCGDDAVEKIRAGASLVQIYSGFIYKGPTLLAEAGRALKASQ